MALSNHASVILQGIEAILEAAKAMKHVRDAQGDLTWLAIHQVQDALRKAKIWTTAAIEAVQRGGAKAEAFMDDQGGPQTLTELVTKAMACELAARSWNDAVAAWIPTLPDDCKIRMVVYNHEGISTRHVEAATFVPAELAAPLRQSQALADLVAAFEAVGA